MRTETLLCAILSTTTPEASQSPQEPMLRLPDISMLDSIVHTSPLLNLSVLQDEPEVPEITQIQRFAAQGTDRWTIQSAFATHESINTLTEIGFGLEFFIIDDLSISTEFNGVYINQDSQNAAGGNFNLLFRWYFLHETAWAVYFESGAGLLWTTHKIPTTGSHFNFVPQAAIGVSLAMEYELRLNIAVGWQHISNANLFENNPGRDSFSIHLGVSLPF